MAHMNEKKVSLYLESNYMYRARKWYFCNWQWVWTVKCSRRFSCYLLLECVKLEIWNRILKIQNGNYLYSLLCLDLFWSFIHSMFIHNFSPCFTNTHQWKSVARFCIKWALSTSYFTLFSECFVFKRLTCASCTIYTCDNWNDCKLFGCF